MAFWVYIKILDMTGWSHIISALEYAYNTICVFYIQGWQFDNTYFILVHLSQYIICIGYVFLIRNLHK